MGYDEVRKWEAINDELSLGARELPEWFSTSPELHEALDIPDSAAARVGRPRKVLGARPARTPGRKRR